MNAAALSSPLAKLGLLAAAAAFNVALAAALARDGARIPVLVALAPVLVLVVGVLLTSRRSLLVFVALALPMTQHSLNKAYPLAGGISIWATDIVVGLALATWLGSRLVEGRERAAPWPRTPVLGLPFVLFAGAVLVALLRGNAEHGQSLVGIPVRLLLYAGIAAAIAGLSAREARRGITVVFYVGTIWMLLNGARYLATGTSQTDQTDLSTGGTRIFSGTVSAYLAVALVLALLNLRLASSAAGRALHTSIAVLALTGVALGLFRSVFVAVALVLPLLLAMPRVRRPLLGILPLAVPFVLVAAMLVPQAAPDLAPSLVERVTASPSTDANVLWRARVRDAIWRQVHESPVIGVGFGQQASATMFAVSRSGLVLSRRDTIGQEGHNSYLWLLAAGGLVTLGAFLLLLATFAVDALRRLRAAVDDDERTIVLFSLLGLVVFLVPGLAGPVLGNAPLLLGVWTLLVLPSIVGRAARAEPNGRSRVD